MSDKEEVAPDTAQRSLDEVRKKLKKLSFHVETRPNGIITFRFDALTHPVLIPWLDYMRVQCEQWTSPLRILYDFRGAGAPSRFFIDRVPNIFEELPLPEDTRQAFLFDDNISAHFTREALNKISGSAEKHSEFMNLDPAIRWLMRDTQ